MSDHRPKGPFRKLVKILIAASLILVVCTGCIYLLYLYMVYSIPYPAHLVNEKVAFQRGAMLCRALNVYYEKRQEYPPFLLGGENRWENENTSVLPVGSPSPDPLLREGIIKRYPKSVIYERRCIDGLKRDPRFRGGTYHVLFNVVSAPNDPVVRSYVAQLSNEIERYPDATGSLLSYRNILEETQEYLEAGGRLYAAGGIIDLEDDYTSRHPPGSPDYTAIVGRLSRLPDLSGRFVVSFSVWRGNFGYTRGEYMGKDPTTAYLWMYGAPTTSEDHHGLDVLNAETGELARDGIPDAVVVIYELKGGEVVNVTRAEDM